MLKTHKFKKNKNGIYYSLPALLCWLYLVVVLIVVSSKLQPHPLEKVFICIAYIIGHSAQAENDCDTIPVINISGARQVQTTNLTG